MTDPNDLARPGHTRTDGECTDALREHIPLGGTRWRLWRDVAVRGAGFPARWFLALCDTELATAADSAVGDPSREDDYDQRWSSSVQRLSGAVSEVAAEPLFREAVAWQNPRLVADCLDKVARGEPRNRRGRYHELAVTSYLQRYCFKNESVGFYGPVGWASLSSTDEGITVCPGPRLLARRTTYFETWAVDELARTIAAWPEVQEWLVPQAVPSAVVVDGVLHVPHRPAVRLTALEACLLDRCDGQRRVADLLHTQAHPGTFGQGAERVAAKEVREALESLRRYGAVRIDLEGPVETWPEKTLFKKIDGIPDPAVRATALAPLERLVTARDAVAAAAGDAQEVLGATAALSGVFEEVTGSRSTRRAGENYAGRTLVYEDTVRDVDVRIGSRVARLAERPLGMLLDSALWFANEAGRHYRALFQEVFDHQCARSHSDALPLWQLTAATAGETGPVTAAAAALQERWQSVLAIPPGARRHQVRSQDIAPQAARQFTTGRPLWSAAAQHSPDMMVCADGPEAAERGECLLVLGELHVAVNTLESRPFVEQHEDPGRLLAWSDADHGDRRIYEIADKRSPLVSSRVFPPSALLSSRHLYWSASQMDSAVPPGPVMSASDLMVHRDKDELVVRSRTTGRQFDLLETMGESLSAAVVQQFKPLPQSPHRPRVCIDQLVVCRESWSFEAADVKWAFLKNERDRYLHARRWVTEHAIPDWVFLKVPVEGKPVATNFTSIPSVNLFAKTVRRTAEAGAGQLTVTEMLPGVEHLWLHDADGNHYTSELRLVAVRDTP